ncbi:MAG: hypothetical protein H6Q85_1197 [candidate division NC10 bacterium]|jgi:hypothetical protein|nr:hypothetical protein [candidate division NC10 bacterium]
MLDTDDGPGYADCAWVRFVVCADRTFESTLT